MYHYCKQSVKLSLRLIIFFTVFPVPFGPRIKVKGVKNCMYCFPSASGPKLLIPCMLKRSMVDIVLLMPI